MVKEKALADRLHKMVKSGARFEALAQEYSTCPSKSKGGDLGWFGPGKMVKEFELAVSQMRMNAVSKVIKTQFGFHIIKKTGER